MASIRPHLTQVSLEIRDVVYLAGERIAHVYFPTGSVLSVLTIMSDGSAVEIGTFGNEGVSGSQIILGGDRPPSQTICQVAGDAYVMPVAAFHLHFETASTFRALMRSYTQALFNFMGQSIACNRLHSINERCARWLLLTHDRVGRDAFDLTQEFLAIMLGVHRPSVSAAAAALQEAGFIRYHRGHLEIRDRAGLESASCECYAISAEEFRLALSGSRREDASA